MIKKMNDAMPTLSKSHRKIAGFIINHYDKAAFMTAAKIAETVGVSEATVVRFASELNYNGYPSLQKAMQETIRNKLTSVQRLEISNHKFDSSDILSSILNMDIEKIKVTLKESSTENFEKVVDVLPQKKAIYIFGARSSAFLASFLGFYFNLIFDNVKIITASNESEIFEQMLWLNSDDILIDISFPRYAKRALTALGCALSKGAEVVAVTDSLSSPIAKSANYVLIARSEMASFVDSLVAPLSLLNALIVASAYKNKVEVFKTFERLEGIWGEYQVYENDVRSN